MTMDVSPVFVWLHGTPYATAIRESGVLFPWIESVHVLALTIVVGSIAVVDLRLLGVASSTRSIASLAAEVLPLTWTAFVIAVITGASLFASHATGYAANFQFRMKIFLLFLAGVNMLSFHWVMRQGTVNWNDAGITPLRGKVAGFISLSLWISIVTFGRWIGFTHVS
jgi:hypothetical protein